MLETNRLTASSLAFLALRLLAAVLFSMMPTVRLVSVNIFVGHALHVVVGHLVNAIEWRNISRQSPYRELVRGQRRAPGLDCWPTCE